MISRQKIRLCGIRASSDVDILLKPTPRLRSLSDVLPNWQDLEQSPPINVEVDVSKIVGSATRFADFAPDFTPLKRDRRLERLEEVVAAHKELGRLNPAQPITLIKYGGEYFVADDGHRRVHLAKREKIEKLHCVVREITV
jgi:hypothetical protein